MALNKDMITEPRRWRLILEPTPDALDVMAYSPADHHAMIADRLPLSGDADPLKALQDAIYDNPLLLNDFHSVSILLPQERFLLLPDLLDDTDSADDAFRHAFPRIPSDAPAELILTELPGMRARIALEVPRNTLGFLRRTFNNPRILHPLTPLAIWFRSRHSGPTAGKMIANLRGRRVDIVILGSTAPLLINSFPIHHPMDAVYYIMACRESLGVRPTDELILAGDPADRTAVMGELRRFIRYVLPAIIPTEMFRAGRAALRAPFEMVLQGHLTSHS